MMFLSVPLDPVDWTRFQSWSRGNKEGFAVFKSVVRMRGDRFSRRRLSFSMTTSWNRKLRLTMNQTRFNDVYLAVCWTMVKDQIRFQSRSDNNGLPFVKW